MNEPVIARPPSAIYRLQKSWQRNKFVFVAGGAIAASLLVGLAASVWQAVRADREAKRTLAVLDELRETAPALAEQARVLASREQFDDAIEKLTYAATLRPEVPAYQIALGDLMQCQFHFTTARAAYRKALALAPGDDRAKVSLTLCDELLAAPPTKNGTLSRESLSKLYLAMLEQQRPASELMPVARLLGEEKKLIVAYWLERLKGLSVSPDRPLSQRLTVREDGLLALDLGGTKITDLRLLKSMPLGSLDLNGCDEILDFTPLADLRSLTSLNLAGARIGDLSSLRTLPLVRLELRATAVQDISPLQGMKLKRLSVRDTRVSNLEPLKGMPLAFFDATAIPATDYTPLAGAPLETLYIQNSPIQSLTFLQNSPLKQLVLAGCEQARGYSVLASLKSLSLLILPRSYRDLPAQELTAIGALRAHPILTNIDEVWEVGIRPMHTAGTKEAFWRNWDQEVALIATLRKSGYPYSLTKLGDGSYKLSFEDQPLSDLSFLKGAAISELWLNKCKVTSLEAIKDLPLKVLGLHANPVADLTPLRKMALKELSIEKTNVSDLTPLQALPLSKLYAYECERLVDVYPLANIPTLEKLILPTGAKNIGSLRALPNLKWISFNMSSQYPYLPDSTREQFWKEFDGKAWLQKLLDSGFVKSQKSAGDGTWEVDLSHSAITDLSLLRGAPISNLWLYETEVEDLAPLKGMPLKRLHLFRTRVKDLSPLQGMPLVSLNLVATPVSDLSPLRGLPLTSLSLNHCNDLTDLSPLKELNSLTMLTLPPNAKQFEFLRTAPKLERLSFVEDPRNWHRPDLTAEEFWKVYDAKQK